MVRCQVPTTSYSTE